MPKYKIVFESERPISKCQDCPLVIYQEDSIGGMYSPEDCDCPLLPIVNHGYPLNANEKPENCPLKDVSTQS